MLNNYIFDFDGTLADTQTAIFETWALTCQQLQLPPISLESIRSTMGWNLSRIAQNIAQGDDINTIQNLVLAYKTNYKIVSNAEPSPIKLFDGIMELLQSLKSQNKQLFVVSAKSSQALTDGLDKLKIKEFFVEIIGAEDVGFTKPNPEAIDILVAKYNLVRSQTLMIGDALVDIQMGQNANVLTCGVIWGATDEQTMSTFGADYIVSQVSDIITAKLLTLQLKNMPLLRGWQQS